MMDHLLQPLYVFLSFVPVGGLSHSGVQVHRCHAVRPSGQFVTAASQRVDTRRTKAPSTTDHWPAGNAIQCLWATSVGPPCRPSRRTHT